MVERSRPSIWHSGLDRRRRRAGAGARVDGAVGVGATTVGARRRARDGPAAAEREARRQAARQCIRRGQQGVQVGAQKHAALEGTAVPDDRRPLIQRRIGDLRFETDGQWKRGGTTVDSLAKELKLALQYPEGADL